MTALRASLMLLTLLVSGVAHALPFDGAPRASDEELDRMRGGFIVNLNGQDFLMAFSIDRLTYINGELVSSITLNPLALTPLSTLQVTTQSSPVQSASAADAMQNSPVTTTTQPTGQSGASTAGLPVVVSNPTVNTQVTTQGGVTFIQNGSGNTVALPSNVSLNSIATIVQNTLNNQVIGNITVMNATIAARQLAAQAQLNAVINQSFRGLN
jgi:hypothetical protein